MKTVKELVNIKTQESIGFDGVIEDEFVYSRKQKDNSNIKTLVDKLKTGIKLDILTLQKVSNYTAGDEDTKYEDEEKKIVTLVIDGGHRIDAIKKYNKLAKKEDNDFEKTSLSFQYYDEQILDYETNKSKLMGASHRANDKSGMPSRNMDTRKCARNLKKANPDWTQKEIGEELNREQNTISGYISDILEDEKATREQQTMRLSQLGWTQEAIGGVIGKSQNRVSQIINNIDVDKIDNLFNEGETPDKIAEYADFGDLDIQTIWSFAMEKQSNWDKINELTKALIRSRRKEENKDNPISDEDVEDSRFLKNHHYWYFNKCWDLMGQKYEGQIPGRIVLNVLARLTKQGDRVIDPMAGGGVVPDACLLMNRKCQAYDVYPSRYDIIEHDITEGVPEGCKKADLIFLDPPYYKKKAEEYGLPEELLTRDGFLEFAESWVTFCKDALKKGGFVALLMGSWYDRDNRAKSIHSWEYPPLFTKDEDFIAWENYQVPISTQHFRQDQEASVNEWNVKEDDKKGLLNNERVLFILRKGTS